LDRFKIALSDTQLFDVLVGCFRSSGFYRLYPSIEPIAKTRIKAATAKNGKFVLIRPETSMLLFSGKDSIAKIFYAENFMQVQLQPEFDEILQPLGSHALEFFLAASLYHARKISFASAAHMAGLDFEAFKTRLSEHFEHGYIIADECVLEDLRTIENL
jgi:hypothetical protein